MLAASIPRMRPVLTTFRSGPWGKARDMHGQCSKRLWLTWRWQPKGWGCIMQWKPQLGLSCHAERPTSKSLQCGSWVRVDMREVSYFSNERHGQKNVQTTINSTLYRALALHVRGGSSGTRRARQRKEGDRTGCKRWGDGFPGHPFICMSFYNVCCFNK